MEYRKLPHGEEKISVLGLGSSSIGGSGEKEIARAAEMAVKNGINYFDLASADDKPFPVYGQVFSGFRDKIYYQIHFGADYATGEYGWTTSLDKIKKSIDWQLKSLKTDYIDFGFIHCIDEEADLEKYIKSGVLEHIKTLKSQGTVRHIGLSSHTPQVAAKILDMGIVDMMMFSINPAYDYQKGEYGIGEVDQRMDLYRRCEKEGTGISVMKAFAAGQLQMKRPRLLEKPLQNIGVSSMLWTNRE